jgi:hypothetical protein
MARKWNAFETFLVIRYMSGMYWNRSLIFGPMYIIEHIRDPAETVSHHRIHVTEPGY